MEIKQAVINDIKQIVDLDSFVIGRRVRENQIRKSIQENRCIVCEINNEIVGFLIYHHYFYGHLFIDLIIVNPRLRRIGIAKKLIEYVENFNENKIFSSTNKSNMPMQKVFHSLGYLESGIIDNLDEGDPEIIFVKLLT
ncbi:GNAT family N-acetyltransferase [Gottfriedia luciferensis]|uniref:GNAT family N-acetyltransferase n=1 Tax=Gottfriedia luciferensis TaxID=178774 RepID=UPI000B43FF7E|nr:GNAT family N-acetyltransferase [Gottfriedia luciferensis]